MSTSAVVLRWSIFVALLLAWPVPMIGLDGSMIPVARFAQLAASLSVLVSIEGAGGMVGTLGLLLWGHVLVYGVLLWAGSWLAVRFVVGRLSTRLGSLFVVALVVGLLAWGTFGRPYDTIFHHSDAHASLLALYR